MTIGIVIYRYASRTTQQQQNHLQAASERVASASTQTTTPQPQTNKSRNQQMNPSPHDSDPTESSTSPLHPLAKSWWHLYSRGNKGRITKPHQNDLLHLANSLNIQDPTTFIPEITKAVDYHRKRRFTPEEDEIIMKFAKTNQQLDFRKLTTMLNRPGLVIRLRYENIINNNVDNPEPLEQEVEGIPPNPYSTGTPIKFETSEEEQQFITNMLRVTLDDGFVVTRALRWCFYPHVTKDDLAATVDMMKRKLGKNNILEMRKVVCEKDEDKMIKLANEMKLDDGRPDFKAIKKEFRDLDEQFVRKKVLYLWKRMHGWWDENIGGRS
ncbi:hypothetical protein HDU76_007230 [Blyttiomyces sp. JEL0837]|nr:hypothetical protein HDU76_007230 [Blyttiomyces sp. JEL0837]